MATLKTLAVNLDLERTRFSGELQATVSDLDRVDDQVDGVGDTIDNFGQTVQQAGKTASTSSSGYGGLSHKILEVGRLAEDASVGFGTNGLTGALRGATNNVVQLASMFNPLAGGIAGITLALVPLAMQFFKVADAAEETNNQFERAQGFATALSRGVSSQVQALQIDQQLGDIGSSEDAQTFAGDLEKQVDLIDAEREAITRSIAELESRAPETEFVSGWLGDSRDTSARDKYYEELITPLQAQLDDLRSQSRTIAGGMGDAQRLAESLQLEEQQAAVEQAQSEYLGERMSEIGGFFNSLPEAMAPLADNLQAAEQQLREFDERMQADLAAREAAELERLQQLADAPAQLTENLQRGSAEAFRQILQQSQERPNQRLETINSEQLAELRGLRRDQSQQRRQQSQYLEEIELT